MSDVAFGGATVPDDHVIVLFGAAGDLARRKLLPGLFHLAEAGLMPERFRVVGTSREQLSGDDFRAHARAAADEFGGRAVDEETWTSFAATLSYVEADDAAALAAAVERAEEQIGGPGRRLHYLSVPPGASAAIGRTLADAGLVERARVIMEKPFGTDLDSARELNAAMHAVFDESQVFRIDHFLGKEAVQNILAFRFANGLFEPVWNRQFIDHVQFDVPETLSVEQRASFYEATGALRDVVVTHVFQVLGFVAMEPPLALSPKSLGDEKVKVFDAMRVLTPGDVVRGQYIGYRELDGVPPDSDTETYTAGRLFIDNWRWKGVPFYFRTGKRMPESRRALTIVFKKPALSLFERADVSTDSIDANHLTFDLGDPGSISASFLVKDPGAELDLTEASMNFSYDAGGLLEAYERLIYDALIGDKSLFARADSIERLWEVVEPVLAAPSPAIPYEQETWGPAEAEELIAPRRWHLPASH